MPWPWVLKLPSILLILHLMWPLSYRHLLLRHPSSIVEVLIQPGRLLLRLSNGEQVPVTVQAETAVWPGIIFLATRHVLTQQAFNLILSPDSLKPAEWHLFRRHLLHNQCFNLDI